MTNSPEKRKPDNHNHHHHHHHASSGDGDDQKALLNALSGCSDKGSRVTLMGLAANISLTAIKGIAGYLLASASLIADAAHSLSDLIGDLITLVAWNWSRKPPDKDYPFGYGKFESLGSLIVAFFLVSGGFGIGFHSYTLLLPILSKRFPDLASILPKYQPDHHQHDTDIRASYFALLSIIAKETLYRITYKVGKAEESSVLIANALHHRSDVFGSLVALLAIIGSWLGLTILDPIGGFIVCSMILSSGIAIGKSSIEGLLDKKQEIYLDRDIENLLLTKLDKLQTDKFTISIQSVKHLKIGPKLIVFLDLGLSSLSKSSASTAASKEIANGQVHFEEWVAIQQIFSALIVKENKNVQDVYIKFKTIYDIQNK